MADERRERNLQPVLRRAPLRNRESGHGCFFAGRALPAQPVYRRSRRSSAGGHLRSSPAHEQTASEGKRRALCRDGGKHGALQGRNHGRFRPFSGEPSGTNRPAHRGRVRNRRAGMLPIQQNKRRRFHPDFHGEHGRADHPPIRHTVGRDNRRHARGSGAVRGQSGRQLLRQRRRSGAALSDGSLFQTPVGEINCGKHGR